MQSVILHLQDTVGLPDNIMNEYNAYVLSLGFIWDVDGDGVFANHYFWCSCIHINSIYYYFITIIDMCTLFSVYWTSVSKNRNECATGWRATCDACGVNM